MTRPREAIILAKLGEVFFNFGIKLLLIFGLFIWFRIPVTWSVVLAPVALIHLIAFGTGIGLRLSPFGTLYGDVLKAIPMITVPWLLITPVVFPPPRAGLFATIVDWNPVTPLLVTTRDLATTGLLTNTTGFWWASVLALVLLLSGWMFFRLAMPFIIERMSS